MAKWARLYPKDVKASVFTIRDATSCKLVVGQRWGDDYLELPQNDDCLRALILSLIEDAGWGVVLLDNLPSHLRYMED